MFPELVQVMNENRIQQLTMESPERLNMVASTQDKGSPKFPRLTKRLQGHCLTTPFPKSRSNKLGTLRSVDLQEVDNAHVQMVLKSTRLKAGMSSTEPRETRLATNFWESFDTSRSEQVAKPLV